MESAAETVAIELTEVRLTGDLVLPGEARGVVVFAHGSGSSRLSSRNRYVASVIREGGVGTLLFDLLSPEEERVDQLTAELRFDIDLLGRRMTEVIDWLRRRAGFERMPLGLFGASTGAAAALRAAAARPAAVAAVVARGGRPDLAGAALGDVRAPTLLIVGGADEPVITLNRQAAEKLRAEHRLVVVPGASHLFPEPGKLEEVAALSRDFFSSRLSGGQVAP